MTTATTLAQDALAGDVDATIGDAFCLQLDPHGILRHRGVMIYPDTYAQLNGMTLATGVSLAFTFKLHAVVIDETGRVRIDRQAAGFAVPVGDVLRACVECGGDTAEDCLPCEDVVCEGCTTEHVTFCAEWRVLVAEAVDVR